MTIYTDPSGRVWRTVSPALANAVLSMIGPDFSMEAAHALALPGRKQVTFMTPAAGHGERHSNPAPDG